jgi:hypothetical protein
MTTRLDGCGHLAPVVNASVEDANFIAIKVIGGEYLDVTEAAIDGGFAQAPEHEGKEAAHEKQSGDASTNHEQRHHGAAAIAKDVAKGEKHELSHS